MDPKTRRILWNCLNKIKNKGKSLILTTHSMDETEALCSNIGIMVNGELKCLGSLQHLKSRYGEGYTLLSKIALINNDREKQTQNINEFVSFLMNSFSSSECKLKENRDGFINIHINDNTTTCLSKIFSLVEENKSRYSIEYYVVTQTKLEQIFLNFASKQIDPETRINHKKRFLFC
jgi:ABC-type multidrug transport system ATPase subunit